jgi:hypothetical protein
MLTKIYIFNRSITISSSSQLFSFTPIAGQHICRPYDLFLYLAIVYIQKHCIQRFYEI